MVFDIADEMGDPLVPTKQDSSGHRTGQSPSWPRGWTSVQRRAFLPGLFDGRRYCEGLLYAPIDDRGYSPMMFDVGRSMFDVRYMRYIIYIVLYNIRDQ